MQQQYRQAAPLSLNQLEDHLRGKKIVKVLTCQKAPSDAQTGSLYLTSGPLGETLHYCNGALRENLNAPNGFDSRRASPEVGDAHMRSACLGGLSTLVSCC